MNTEQKLIDQWVLEATVEANLAGDEWMKNAKPRFSVHSADLITGKPNGPSLGTMLDVCGNAHVQFRDKRSKFYKMFTRTQHVRGTGNAVVEIYHKYRGRQEYGLMVACAEAAKKFLESKGVIGLRVWSYVD